VTDDPWREPPEQPTTKNLPAADPVQVLLLKLQRSLEDGFRTTNANIDVVANDLSVVKSRVEILENERTKLSGGVRGLSSLNAEQDAQLAQERMAREAVAKEVQDLKDTNAMQLAILSRLDKVASNPHIKIILAVLAAAAMSWAASKGLK
jgi:hypothetical protein